MIKTRLSSIISGERAIWVVLLTGLVLRCIGIDGRGIQYDDAFTILLSERSLGEIISGTAADTMPPLYYWMLHFWMTISKEIWFLRLLSITLNLLTVYVFYHLVKRLFDRRAGIWAALFAAIAPIQLYHAQDIRMYSLLLLAQTTYTYFFIRIGQDSPSGKKLSWDWLWLILSGVIAMYSHNLAIFALIIPDCFLLFKRKWRSLSRLVLAQLAIGLLSMPWLLQLPDQLTKVQRAWSLPRPGLLEIVQALVMFTGSLPLPWILTVIVTLISVQILVVLVIETVREGRKNDAISFLGMMVLIPPVILFGASYIIRPIFIPRGFLLSSLAYYALLGYVVARHWPRGLSPAIAGAFILAVGLSLPSFYTFNQFPRSPYREAVGYLSSVIQPDDVIIHDNKLSYLPSYVYSKDLPQTFLPDPPASSNDTLAPDSMVAMNIFPSNTLESTVDGADRVYYVVFTRTIEEYMSLGSSNHPNLEWLGEHFRKIGKESFEDMEIYIFDR